MMATRSAGPPSVAAGTTFMQRSQTQLAGDDHAVDLRGPLQELRDPNIPVPALQGEFLAVTLSSVDQGDLVGDTRAISVAKSLALAASPAILGLI